MVIVDVSSNLPCTLYARQGRENRMLKEISFLTLTFGSSCSYIMAPIFTLIILVIASRIQER